MKNIVIIHGGGPTAVINASLYGAITAAKMHNANIYAAMGGTGGLLRENIKLLNYVDNEVLEKLPFTPGSAIGTSRDPLFEQEYANMLSVLKKHNIDCVLLNGGNGTMDTCGKLSKFCQKDGIAVMGIPKTMDNDLSVGDHAPGFASYARYVAASIAELSADVQGLPIHAVVVEILGRNAGWAVASSAVAKDEFMDGADLIYFPELAFSEDKFLKDVENKLKEKKGIIIAVSEGLRDKHGSTIVKPIFKTDRAEYFGDISAHLCQLIIRELGYKARNEKPGIIGRASAMWQSEIDRQEAILVGKLAVESVLKGETDKIVGINRISSQPYSSECFLSEINKEVLKEKTLPRNYINKEGNGASQEFINWCRPLIGELPKLVTIKGEIIC